MKTEQTVMRENSSLLTGGQVVEAITKIPVMDIASVCSSNGTKEGTGGACDRKGLGISLSTPILMMSTGVLGNLLALLILFTAEKQVRRTSFFPLLMAMACSDLVGQAATGAIAVLVYANNLEWVGGRPVCLYHGFTMVFFAVITPLLVCSMSVERLLALRYSYFYQRYITHSIARWVVVGSVAFTLFFCSWPLMGFGSYEKQFPGSWCFLNYHRQSTKDMIYALIFSVLNIAIIFFIVACNVTVVYTLLRMRRLRHQMNAVPGKAGRKILQARQRSRSGLNLEMETQMVWFLLAITVVFSCLWLPINVHILMNQITGKKDFKQDLISVRLASINQIIDPWMYVIFRKGTFLKLLRQLRVFITSRKKSTLSSLKPSHSCEDHRLKLLMPPRSQSCPPAVFYSVDGSAAPSDQLNSQLYPQVTRSRLAAVALSTDDFELSMTGTTDSLRPGMNFVKMKPLETLEHSDVMENSSEVVREGLTKSQSIPNIIDKANPEQVKVLKSSESLNIMADDASNLKANFRKSGDIFDVENGVESLNDNLTKTELTLDVVGNGDVNATRKDCTKTNGCIDDMGSNANPNGNLDIQQTQSPHKISHISYNNKRPTRENDRTRSSSESDYSNVQNGVNCFLENELKTCKKGVVHASRNADKQQGKRRVAVAETIDTHVISPSETVGSITNNHIVNQVLESQNQADHVPERSATSQNIDDNNSGCEIDGGRDSLTGQLSPLPSERQFCDVDNGYTPEHSVHTKSVLDHTTCAADFKECETTSLLRVNGCVNQFLQTSVDLCQCSNNFCGKHAHKKTMMEEYSKRLRNATAGEKQHSRVGSVVIDT